jgi:hypothetical protein
MSQHEHHRVRRGLAFAANLIAPGAGLVILRRDALGVALVVLFVILAQVAVWGLFLVPSSIPDPVSIVACVGAGVVWLVAQWMAHGQARRAFGVETERELALLRDRVARAIEDERYADARDLLGIGRQINDEDLDLQVQTARLLTREGQLPEARRVWQRVIELDRSGQYRKEADTALAHS